MWQLGHKEFKLVNIWAEYYVIEVRGRGELHVYESYCPLINQRCLDIAELKQQLWKVRFLNSGNIYGKSDFWTQAKIMESQISELKQLWKLRILNLSNNNGKSDFQTQAKFMKSQIFLIQAIIVVSHISELKQQLWKARFLNSSNIYGKSDFCTQTTFMENPIPEHHVSVLGLRYF